MATQDMTMRHLAARAGAFALLVLACSMPAAPARAADVFIGPSQIPGAGLNVRVRSFLDRKFQETVRQSHDYSCGSAALATLLTYSYNIPSTEESIFRDMITHGDRAAIEKRGFSLLDLKDYLARHGLQSGGFRAPLAKLAEVKVPAIVLIEHNGYRHFVVVRGVREGRVLVSDPSLGTRSIPEDRFLEEWNGIFFLVLTEAERAQADFNAGRVWAAAPRAPIGLSRFQIDLMVPPNNGILNSSIF